MKRIHIFTATLLLILIAWALPVRADAEEIVSGTCGDNLTWTLDNEGTLTISGTGKMYDYEDFYSDVPAPWTDNWNKIKSIKISEGVASIGNFAFSDCYYVTKLEIPASVTSIGDDVFWGCSNLLYVTFYGNAPQFSSCTFEGMYDPITVFYPVDNSTWTADIMHNYGNTYKIWWLANTPNLESILRTGSCGDDLTWTLYKNCTLVISGTGEMYNYNKWGNNPTPWGGRIQAVELSEGITSIGAYAFSHSPNLTNIQLPDSITNIGNAAFSWSGLQKIELPNSITSIGEDAFYATWLSEIEIPKSVTSIGNYAFTESSIDSITFYGDAPMISPETFYCTTATAYYPKGNNTWSADVMQNYGGDITWVAFTHEHDYITVVTAPTCTKQGYSTYTCDKCENSYVGNYVEALGHNYSTWETVTAATCTKNGEQKHTCSRCHAVETQIIPSMGHSEVIDSAVKATCTEAGYTEGKHCNLCDNILKVQELVPALGHSFKDSFCINCGVAEESGVSLGDANGDNTIDNVDAMLILQFTVGLYNDSTLNMAACDVNSDGSVDNVDAMRILQYSVGLITSFQ